MDLFFCTHAGYFFFFLQNYTRRIAKKNFSFHLPIVLMAVNAFIGVSDVQEKVLFMVFLKSKEKVLSGAKINPRAQIASA